MLEFDLLEELNPNAELLDIIKDYSYNVNKGTIKHLLHTSLQVIEPPEYLITYPTTITILEYKINEISNKPFFIKEHNQKYSLSEITQILKKLKI